MKILILNGPNLNLLGKREPNIYGNKSFEQYFRTLQLAHKNVELSYAQSNIEGELINNLQTAKEEGFEGVILNAAAYTHTSIALADTIRSMTIPVVEVHISNVFAREKYRQKSYLSPYVKGVISGFGLASYALAIQSLLYETVDDE